MINPDKDYYGWSQETAEKLRQGKFSEVNMEDLIEELEDMGRSERCTRNYFRKGRLPLRLQGNRLDMGANTGY